MDLFQSESRWRPQPGVINTEMIRQQVKKMIQDEIPGVKFDEGEEYEFKEITQMYLEHLEIFRIDHLWIMPNLTILKLTGNLISKIENLETLVHLVDLNLSFNRIEKIENLDSLTQLRHLSLFSNLISRIENLNHLKELKIFTIGSNKIVDRECVLHMRKMNLFSLNMAENPCTKDAGFREYVAAYLPALEYYEYIKISSEERQVGREENLVHLEALEREEAEENERKEIERTEQDKKELHERAFVEDLDGDQLYEAMVEADSTGPALMLIGEEITEIFNKFKENVGIATKEIFTIGLQQLKLRDQEIETYHQSVQIAVVRSREKQRTILEEFLDSKSGYLVDLVGLLDDGSTEGTSFKHSMDEALDKANLLCLKIKRELLTLELTVSEQIKEVFSLFERTVNDMINSFVETAQGFFTTMREHETVLGEQLNDQTTRFLTQLSIRGEDLTSLPVPLRPIMADKETINTALASCHDVYLQTIDNREDRLMSRARSWVQKLCQDIEQEETNRFRDRISEIVHFLELQANEFKQYNVNVDEEAYILAEAV